jgi:hypothetical protein
MGIQRKAVGFRLPPLLYLRKGDSMTKEIPMIFHVELRTDDQELIEVLGTVRNRAKFVKRALRHYISTRTGKEALKSLSKPGAKNLEGGKIQERQKPEKSSPLTSDNGKKGSYDLDSFL